MRGIQNKLKKIIKYITLIPLPFDTLDEYIEHDK